jgi:D-alanyl-D-alanine carboxypeptidase (penicillin-binding protein 5/6)
MIRKIIGTIICFLIMILFNFTNVVKAEVNSNTTDNTVTINTLGKSSLLMEFNSGKIIFAKNEHEKLAPASMTKMMGLYLVLNAIKDGKLTWDEEVQVSSNAASMGGTQIFLQPGEVMTVQDLFKSVAINSANDAMFALGEKVGGSDTTFIKMMNDTAKQLGMKDTNFVNMVGFDDDNHYSSAYDMAILGRTLLSHGNEILRFTSQYDGYVRENTANPFWLVNTNKLVKFYNGMDGLKTGFTQKSKYCLTATAMRNNVRFIAVSMGNNSINERSQDITNMLNYGFAHYASLKVYNQGDVITNIRFNDAKNPDVPIVAKTDIYVVVKKGDKLDSLKAKVNFFDTSAPKKEGEVLGHITITNSDGWEARFEIATGVKVEKLTLWSLFIKTLYEILL